MNWYTITDSIGSRYVSLVIFRFSELLIHNVYSKHSCARRQSKYMLTQTRLPSSITLWSSPDARLPIFGAFSGGQGSARPSCQVVWCSGICNVLLSLLTPFYQNPNEPLAIWAKAAHPLDRTARASLLSPGTRISLDLVCSSPVVPSSDNWWPGTPHKTCRYLYDLGAEVKMFICCLVYSRDHVEEIISVIHFTCQWRTAAALRNI